MVLEKLFSGGKAEQKVVETIRKQITVLRTACETFRDAFEKGDKNLMTSVADLEREGDSMRRKIVSSVYEGAFLPFLRPSLCRFVEIVDQAFDTLEDAAFEFEFIASSFDAETKDDCLTAARLNVKMCEMLLIAFDSLFIGGDLREKTLAVRIYEKRIDEVKFDIIRSLRKREVISFWEGKSLSDFVTYLTGISDIIEDASDYLHTINLRLR
ncbi:MAG: TIGR00153 family protein [Chloroflexota bacterium]|jgi:uncharacterized protein